MAQSGARLQFAAAAAPQAPRGQAAPQPSQISIPAAGATYAGTLQQPDVASVTTVYRGPIPGPVQQDAPPLVQTPVGYGGGTGALGAVPPPPLPGYGAAFNAADAGFGLTGLPVDGHPGDAPAAAGLTGAAAAQWAHSALAAGYIPGGVSALGNFAAPGQVGGLPYGGAARPGDPTGAAGVSTKGAATRAMVAGGYTVGNGVAPVGCAALAAALTAGALTQQHQQQPQKGGGEQPQADSAAAAVVAEHLEAAHRAYKAGRHLEALQLCNTVRTEPQNI